MPRDWDARALSKMQDGREMRIAPHLDCDKCRFSSTRQASASHSCAPGRRSSFMHSLLNLAGFPL